MTPAEGRGRKRAPDGSEGRPYPFSTTVLVGLCFSAILALAAYGLLIKHGIAPGIIGYNLVPSERVLNGQVPYRDFVYNYTPGLLWYNAALFKLMGTSLLASRLGVYFCKVIAIILLYLIASRYLDGWKALLPVLMAVAWIGYGDPLKVFPTQYGMPFLLAAWLAMLKAGELSSPRQRGIACAIAGLFVGIVFLFKQNVGLFGLFAGCASAAVFAWPHDSARQSVRDAIVQACFVLLGFSVPAVIMVLYLAGHSALVPMLSHFARHSVAYEESKGNALPNPVILAPSIFVALAGAAAGVAIRSAAPRALLAYLLLVFCSLLLLVALGQRLPGPMNPLYRSLVAEVYYLPIYLAIGTVCVAILLRRKLDFRHLKPVAAGLFFSVAAFLEIFPRSDADHLVRVLPPSFVMICVLFSAHRWRSAPEDSQKDSQVAQENKLGASVRSVLLVGLSVLIMSIGIKLTWAPLFNNSLELSDQTPLLFERGKGVMGSKTEADRLNNLVKFVQDSTGPDDSILAVSRQVTSAYFLAARQNTTGLEWFDSPGVPQAVRDDIYNRIQRRDFKLVIMGLDMSELEGEEKGKVPRERKRLGVLLRQYYQESAVIDGVTCFAPLPSSQRGAATQAP